MRALLSLGLDLLGHPVWLIAVTCGLVAGGWLAVIANDAAKREQRQRESDAIFCETKAEWQRLQRSPYVHRVARSIGTHRVKVTGHGTAAITESVVTVHGLKAARSIVSPDDPKAA